VRLNRYLSQCGLGSRRSCELIVREGRVSINGQQITELATEVAETDRVNVDGNPVRPHVPLVLVLHKPAGYLCTREDTHNRPTIYDILPAKFHSLHHVGRLDQDSEGLILLTNQGDLSQRLLHPSEGVEKEYEVTLDKDFDPKHAAKLVRGIQTVEGFGRAEHVHVDSPKRLHVVLKQGLKRQIRLMFYEIGYEVVRLIRVRIGGLRILGLGVGQWRELRPTEVEQFFRAAKPRKNRTNVKADDDAGDDSFPSTRTSLRPKGRKDAKTDPDRRTGPKPGQPRLGGARKAYGEKRYGGSSAAGSSGAGESRRPRSSGSSSEGRSGSYGKPTRSSGSSEGRSGSYGKPTRSGYGKSSGRPSNSSDRRSDSGGRSDRGSRR
jgi:23S rRNA pseudouridine2605 synthase